jgi:excisionase family DNA binding protein
MPRAKQPKEVMSLNEFQKYLRIGNVKALELLTSGKIPGQKIGTRWRIHRQAVENWLLTPSNKKEAAG